MFNKIKIKNVSGNKFVIRTSLQCMMQNLCFEAWIPFFAFIAVTKTMNTI